MDSETPICTECGHHNGQHFLECRNITTAGAKAWAIYHRNAHQQERRTNSRLRLNAQKDARLSHLELLEKIRECNALRKQVNQLKANENQAH